MNRNRNNGADTERPTRPGTFRPGNPGRPLGARNRVTLAAMTLLEGEAEALTRRCVELALAGYTTAMRGQRYQVPLTGAKGTRAKGTRYH